MQTIVTFGEIMMRIAAEDFLRFRQSFPGKAEITFAGAEANVAVSIALFGGNSRYVTALPKHSIADACIDTVRGLGVDVNYILKTDKGRLGIYFLETGANQRPSNVIYDRENSSVSFVPFEKYDWKGIFDNAGWLHISGITPALSGIAADCSIKAVKVAKSSGLCVSCDLNFRKKLWKWDQSMSPKQLAQKTMREILPYVDVLIGNEEDASDVLGIAAGDADIEAGKLDAAKYKDVARKIVEQFPNISKVAITLRQSISATHNNWGAMLYDSQASKAYFAPVKGGEYEPYKITDIVDRVGGGDSFAAGLIFALNSEKYCTPDKAISFAAAASCLAHSIKGDFNYIALDEVEALMAGSSSGRVKR
ncbi:MAG: sugar kinase [Sedimentisphaerales bacterium]